MIKEHTIPIYIFLASFGMFFAFSHVAFAGLGISPPEMKISGLSRGSEVTKQFILSRSKPDSDLVFNIRQEGDTKDWIIVDKGDTFVMPKGEKRLSLRITALIPSNIHNGEYRGGIRIMSSSSPRQDTSTTSGASTELSALIKIHLTISGEEVRKYTISSISTEDIEQGAPLPMYILINNMGNTDARPTKLHLQVYDKLFETLLFERDISDMTSIEPFHSGIIDVQIPLTLDVGQYRARTSVYEQDALLKSADLTFDVTEPGVLQKKGILENVTYATDDVVGATAEARGTFTNTSKQNYTARLVTEIFHKDGSIQMIEGVSLHVASGETIELVAPITAIRPGKYTTLSHVEYSGISTPNIEKRLKINSHDQFGAIGVLGVSTILLMILVVLVPIIFILLPQYWKDRFRYILWKK